MELFLNISGSALLILAGVLVLWRLITERGTAPYPPNKLCRKKFTRWLIIFFGAVLSRWIVFFICFLLEGDGRSFWEFIRTVFEKAGDTPHYLYLAEYGYALEGEKANLLVFYPLYPWLMRIFKLAAGDYFLSGLIVSSLCFGIGSCFFYELMRLDFNIEQSASGLLLLFFAPYGLFFGAVYTESLFIMLTVMCLYFMRRRKYIPMAICGFFACLSRTQGIILFICALCAALEDFLTDRKIKKTALICTLAIPLGFLGYLLLNKVIGGEWFKYIQYQSAPPWYNSAHWFGKSLSQSYSMAKQYEGLANIIYYPQLILFFIGTGAIFYGFYKRLWTPYLVYTGVYIFTCYTHGWLISGSRYICACIPLYIIFASCKNRYIHIGILLLSAVCFFAVTRLWVKGYAIM
ncbi:MAG: glycosyltransferase family 39 protein [Clostridiales bacterium]|nr:glycosyltransferase family 39 protein [Clostridiales bacterium]